jgi:hypothetical protein
MKLIVQWFCVTLCLAGAQAQGVSFGLANESKNDKFFFSIIGSNNLSYSIQYSPNSTNSFGPISLPGGLINGKITFVQTNVAQVGYYRALTVSNNVTYYSTNHVVAVTVAISATGSLRQISIRGPTNLVYTVEAAQSLGGSWIPAFVGSTGQTNFTDSLNSSQRFYRLKTQ